MTILFRFSSLLLLSLVATTCRADIFLNAPTIDVSLGASMSAEPFVNRTTAQSLASIIDAPTAGSSEFHRQSTHIWVSGKPLEIEFNLKSDYDLKTFHFWNYHGETWDVDDIDLRFYDASRNLVGSLLNIAPALGNATGFDSTPIFAQNFAINFSDVRYVNATLSGSNGEIDFNNIGFSGVVAVPEPSSSGLAIVFALGLMNSKRIRSRIGKKVAALCSNGSSTFS